MVSKLTTRKHIFIVLLQITDITSLFLIVHTYTRFNIQTRAVEIHLLPVFELLSTPYHDGGLFQTLPHGPPVLIKIERYSG